MKHNIIKTPVLLLLLIAFTSCNNRPSGEKPADTEKQTKPEVFVPGFNADSAFYYIEKQVAFGPRVPNTAGIHRGGIVNREEYIQQVAI